MKIKSLDDLLIDQLRDLYNAETQLIKALPKMVKNASAPELKAAFESHLEETRRQVERLVQVFESLETKAKGKTCKAMEGIIEEAKEILEEDVAEDVLDAALISAAQRVEHYEIAGYGTVRSWARQLGHQKAAKLLEQTLHEEEAADRKLTKIAESRANMKAEMAEE